MAPQVLLDRKGTVANVLGLTFNIPATESALEALTKANASAVAEGCTFTGDGWIAYQDGSRVRDLRPFLERDRPIAWTGYGVAHIPAMELRYRRVKAYADAKVEPLCRAAMRTIKRMKYCEYRQDKDYVLTYEDGGREGGFIMGGKRTRETVKPKAGEVMWRYEHTQAQWLTYVRWFRVMLDRLFVEACDERYPWEARHDTPPYGVRLCFIVNGRRYWYEFVAGARGAYSAQRLSWPDDKDEEVILSDAQT